MSETQDQNAENIEPQQPASVEQPRAAHDNNLDDGFTDFDVDADEPSEPKKPQIPDLVLQPHAQGSNWDHDEVIVKYGATDPTIPMEEKIALSPNNTQFFEGEAGERLDRIDEDKVDQEQANWLNALKLSFSSLIREDGQGQAVARIGSNWNTALVMDDIELRPRKHTLGQQVGNRNLVGVDAMAKATAFTTVGAIVQIPLYHSGFWVTIKAPLDGALLELERQLAIDRADFGRLTHGKVFSLSESVLRGAVAKFAIEHIVESTLDFADKSDFYKHIKLLDLPYLISGLALAIYPSGYPIVQPCLASPDTCSYIAEGKVMISKMMRVDNTEFCREQIEFMANRNKRVSVKEIEKYLDGFKFEHSPVAGVAGDRIKFRFKSPSLADYFEEGYRWVAELESAVEKSFGAKLSLIERNEQITSTAAASAMRQYAHWVERVTYLDKSDEENSYVQDRQSLYETLERYSADETISDKFYDAVTTYINSRTISLLAIPDFVCPSCHNLQNAQATGRFRWLIPQDAIGTFFTVLHHRTNRVVRRTDI